MQHKTRPTAPDDIILFESGEWSFWGDLNGFDAAQCETRDYAVIRFETAQWHELVRKEHPDYQTTAGETR